MRSLGRFELHERIGEGGFGTVYRAWDPLRRRYVALKALLPHLAADADTRARFAAEARALAPLDHEYIVSFYDVDDEAETPFFTMELIEGPTVADVIVEKGPLPFTQVAAILRHVCAAVAYLHDAGMVHRDLKASNVMLDPAGRAVLMDLGIARAADGVTNTLPGVVWGTPESMAPEQVQGALATTASDIYSLGVFAYYMLAGDPPFVGDPMGVCYSHVYRDVPDLRVVRPGLPAPVYDAIDDALAKDPARRPATALAFFAAFSDGVPATERADGQDDAPAFTLPLPAPAPLPRSSATSATLYIPRPRFTERPATSTPSATPAIDAADHDAVMPAAVSEQPAAVVEPTPTATEPAALANLTVPVAKLTPTVDSSQPTGRRGQKLLAMAAALLLVAGLGGAGLRAGALGGGATHEEPTAVVSPVTALTRASQPTAVPVVTALPPAKTTVDGVTVYENVFTGKSEEIVVTDRLDVCFAINQHRRGEPLLVLLTADGAAAPRTGAEPSVLGRSDLFTPAADPTACQQVRVLAPPLPTGWQLAWVLQGDEVLARAAFRVVAPPVVVAPTPAPEPVALAAEPAASAPEAEPQRAPVLVPPPAPSAPRLDPANLARIAAQNTPPATEPPAAPPASRPAAPAPPAQPASYTPPPAAAPAPSYAAPAEPAPAAAPAESAPSRRPAQPAIPDVSSLIPNVTANAPGAPAGSSGGTVPWAPPLPELPNVPGIPNLR